MTKKSIASQVTLTIDTIKNKYACSASLLMTHYWHYWLELFVSQVPTFGRHYHLCFVSLCRCKTPNVDLFGGLAMFLFEPFIVYKTRVAEAPAMRRFWSEPCRGSAKSQDLRKARKLPFSLLSLTKKTGRPRTCPI